MRGARAEKVSHATWTNALQTLIDQRGRIRSIPPVLIEEACTRTHVTYNATFSPRLVTPSLYIGMYHVPLAKSQGTFREILNSFIFTVVYAYVKQLARPRGISDSNLPNKNCNCPRGSRMLRETSHNLIGPFLPPPQKTSKQRAKALFSQALGTNKKGPLPIQRHQIC